MSNCQKVAGAILISLLTLLLIVPEAWAGEQASISINGQEYQADIYIDEKGVSYISAASLAKIPGLAVSQDDYVALRSFFESQGGEVSWDSNNSRIMVSWQERNDNWTTEELLVKSSEKMKELNTYNFNGEATMKINMAGLTVDKAQEIPATTIHQEAVFQQAPLAMYMKQTIKLPLEGMNLTEEELAQIVQGGMVTEIVWKDNAIYQKMSSTDQWIVQDLNEAGIMDKYTQMLQISPQQSLQMMRDSGVINVFGEDVIIGGQEYYTIKTYINSASFKKLSEELFGEFKLDEVFLSGNQGLSGQDEEEMAKVMEMTLQMLNNMELDYNIESLINKDTLLTEYMKVDMALEFKLDEKASPEAPLNLGMEMAGEYKLSGFGAEIQLPEISKAITQQEFLEKMHEEMKATVPEGTST